MPPIVAGAFSLDTFAAVVNDALDRAGEPIDGSSDYLVLAERQATRIYHELLDRKDYLFLRAWPPLAFLTQAPITAGTLAVTLGSTAITFSAPPAASVAGLELLVAGWAEAYRIATHTAGLGAATLDAAFQGPTAAAAAYTVLQREYDLGALAPAGPGGTSILRHIVEMTVAEQGWTVFQRDEGWLRRWFPDPPRSVWPPQYFARIQDSRIRFEGYPDRARRIEVAYTQIPGDPDANSILLPRDVRYVWADGVLYWLLLAKNDTRADAAGIKFERGALAVFAEDNRKRQTVGAAQRPAVGRYR